MNKRTVGTEYEEKTCAYLRAEGFQILERNFRNRVGEIDIVAREGDTLAFIEVKYRRGNALGLPEEAVTSRKQRTIRQVSLYYLMKHPAFSETPVRYDVAAFEGEKLRYYRNAF